MKSGGFQVKSGGFQVKSTPNLVKSEVFAETSAADFWNIWFHLKSARFHGEICQISWISWNPPDFMKSVWNPADFMKSGGFQVKSGGFHEIRQISGEIHPKPCKIRRVFAETSVADFWNIWFHLKSTRFHGEISQISWISWNLPDFMKSIWNTAAFMKSSGFQVKSGGFHEIWQISGEIHPKPCKIRRVFAETSVADFWNIWFHLKSTRFHGEICQISWWNPPDFMVKSARFHERELLGDDQV